MHVRDDQLRTFADGELNNAARRTVQAHLESCADCRERLEALHAGLSVLDARLSLLAPEASQHPRADRALARLHAQIQIEEETRQWVGGNMLKKLGLSRNWERALTGLAAALVVVALFSFAPVRAAASEFLSIFRLERIVILPVDVEDIERLENASRELGRDFFPGQTEVLVEPGEPQHPASLEEASALAGFTVRAPATHPPADDLVVRGEMVTRFMPDLEAVQLLFEAAGLSPDLVPPEIDGQPFDFTMPASVMQIWGEDEGQTLMVMQMPGPTADFPDEVDEEALGIAMLRLLGLSEEDAAALSASIDWSTTLVLPLPASEADFEPVTVDGVEGFLMRGTPEGDPEASYTGVLWQKNGIVHLVVGVEDGTRMLEIANSLQ